MVFILVQTLARHKKYLQKVIDPDSGLLDKLYYGKTLSAKEFRSVIGNKTYEERNAKLLDYMTDQRRCNSFIDSLRNTKQTHVVNYLVGDGKFDVRFGSDWPLTNIQIEILNNNEESLIDLIDERDVLATELQRGGIFDKRQRRLFDLSSKENNKAFIQTLRRMSQKAFRYTLKCLCEKGLKCVAQVLDEGGVLLRIRVSTNATAKEKNEIEDVLPRILGGRSFVESGHIRQLREFKVIAVQANPDLVLYSHCRMLKELEHLQTSLKSGQLHDLAENLFNELLDRLRRVKVLNIAVENEDTALRVFEFKYGRRTSDISEEGGCRVTPQTALKDLPFELLDLILQSSYFLLDQNSESTNQISILEYLMTVNSLWCQRLNRRWFKGALFRLLAVPLKRRSKRYIVVKNNREFLMEFIQPSDEIIDKLESAEYLTKAKVDIIQKLHGDKDKTFEILNMLQPSDSRKVRALTRCLRETNQNQAASVIAKGGVVAKAIARNEAAEKQVMRSLNDLQSESPGNSKPFEVISHENSEKNFHRSRKIKVIWIWFLERNAFEAAKTLLAAEHISFDKYLIADESVMPKKKTKKKKITTP